YDQALALIVFADQGMWSNADTLIDALVATQNPDGSWFRTHDCDTLAVAGDPTEKWEGDIAWADYALSRYLLLGGVHPFAASARNRAADWLATLISPVDRCLMRDHTEATIDTWWALQSAGRVLHANMLKRCLLTFYWDDTLGRFKGGKSWWQPYLDNQTWGA